MSISFVLTFISIAPRKLRPKRTSFYRLISSLPAFSQRENVSATRTAIFTSLYNKSVNNDMKMQKIFVIFYLLPRLKPCTIKA